MTRLHHAVIAFPRLEYNSQPARSRGTTEEGSEYLEYLLSLADRLINGDDREYFEAA